MDVAKYIGTFLLKNQFCYIHGLGNLELRRKPASSDGESLQGPQYTVALTTGGSIDDNLAAFIANGEQTSISKAANALRDFATDARARLQAGEVVPLPGVGHFTRQGGSISFVTDESLSYRPPSVPVIKNAKRLEEEPTFKTMTTGPAATIATMPADRGVEVEHARPSIAWGKVILVSLLVLAVIAAVIFGLRYLNAPDAGSELAPPRTEVAVPAQPLQTAPDTASITAASDTAATTAPASINESSSGAYRVALNTYNTRAQAERRVRFLSSTALGNVAAVVSMDSTTFRVVIPYTAAVADSSRVLDSLRRLYGGKAVLVR